MHQPSSPPRADGQRENGCKVSNMVQTASWERSPPLQLETWRPSPEGAPSQGEKAGLLCLAGGKAWLAPEEHVSSSPCSGDLL